MKPAEFEEKEYESVLYHQLEAGNLEVWSPGQVLERHFGIDHAAMVRNSAVWRLIGRHVPPGVFMHRYDWAFVWRNRPSRRMPNFRLNLFIQAKRPIARARFPRAIESMGLESPGWSFDTQIHQQQALEAVARTVGARAAIVYAAPAFDNLRALYRHIRFGTVVENSTFPGVDQLSGHVRWYYARPGADGVANPSFEPSSGPSLVDRVERLRQMESRTVEMRPESAAQALLALANDIVSAVETVTEDNPRAAFFFSELRTLDRELSEVRQSPGVARDFGRVAVFAHTFNVEWYVI